MHCMQINQLNNNKNTFIVPWGSKRCWWQYSGLAKNEGQVFKCHLNARMLWHSLISVSRFQNGGISNDECMLNQVSVGPTDGYEGSVSWLVTVPVHGCVPDHWGTLVFCGPHLERCHSHVVCDHTGSQWSDLSSWPVSAHPPLKALISLLLAHCK